MVHLGMRDNRSSALGPHGPAGLGFAVRRRPEFCFRSESRAFARRLQICQRTAGANRAAPDGRTAGAKWRSASAGTPQAFACVVCGVCRTGEESVNGR